PCCLNERLVGIKALLAVPIAVITLPKDSGIGWPASLSRAGFGSNRSRWLGPPSMNSQMTDFARVGKCGGRGDRGLSGSLLRFDARANRPSKPSMSPNDSAAKPQQA